MYGLVNFQKKSQELYYSPEEKCAGIVLQHQIISGKKFTEIVLRKALESRESHAYYQTGIIHVRNVVCGISF